MRCAGEAAARILSTTEEKREAGAIPDLQCTPERGLDDP